MKSIKNKMLFLIIGVAFIMWVCAGYVLPRLGDPLEQLKTKTETAALKLSKTILQSQLGDSTQIAKYLTENGWPVIIVQEGSGTVLSTWTDTMTEPVTSPEEGRTPSSGIKRLLQPTARILRERDSAVTANAAAALTEKVSAAFSHGNKKCNRLW